MRHALVLVVLGLIAACHGPEPEGNSQQPVRVDQRMAATPDAGFARALETRQFVFPRDHGAHPDFATEWWYFTGNLRDAEDRPFGYQLTLFRIGLKPGEPVNDSDWRSNQLYMGHFAISDIEDQRHYSGERFSRAAAGLAGATASPLNVWLGPWSIRGSDTALFPLQIEASTADMGISLSLRSGSKAMVLQGDNGLSRKGAMPGNASYYYSYTRLPTSGEIRFEGQRLKVTGDSWFDREWSSSALAPDQAGWDWFALQLDDGQDLMYYRMRGKDGRAQPFSNGVLVKPDGRVIPLSPEQVELKPIRSWRSDEGTNYPVAWALAVPDHALDLRIEAAIDDQEMDLTVRYWEGAVTVEGSQQGVGYLELSGYTQ
jgi:predicted secreted hydrolase